MQTLKLALLALYLSTREITNFDINDTAVCPLGLSPIVFPNAGLKNEGIDENEIPINEWHKQYQEFYGLSIINLQLLFGGQIFNKFRKDHGYVEYKSMPEDQKAVVKNISKFLSDNQFTIKDFSEVVKGEIFLKGDIEFNSEYWGDKPVRWIAKRGALNDWAMYYLPICSGLELDDIRMNGSKMLATVAAQIINCSDEVKDLYRR